MMRRRETEGTCDLLEWAWWLVSGAELEVGDCCRDF